jgi:hypothetical protein
MKVFGKREQRVEPACDTACRANAALELARERTLPPGAWVR